MKKSNAPIVSDTPIWFPAGAGGSWLNYLVWCSTTQTSLDHPFTHFRYHDVLKVCSSFKVCLKYVFHYVTPDTTKSPMVILGSNRAWINFWILMAEKYDADAGDTWIPTPKAYYRPDFAITFNLDWCDIFQDPEKFLYTLSRLLEYRIKYDQHTQHAIEQYQRTCSHLNLDRSDLWSHPLVQLYLNENQLTQQQAEELLWTKFSDSITTT